MFLFEATFSNIFIIKVDGIFQRLEREIKTVWIIHFDNKKKIHFCQGAGTKGNLLKGEGGFFQKPAQTRHMKQGNEQQEQYSDAFHYVQAVRFPYQEYIPFFEKTLQSI